MPSCTAKAPMPVCSWWRAASPAPRALRCPRDFASLPRAAARLRHARVLLAWSWKLTTKQRGFL